MDGFKNSKLDKFWNSQMSLFMRICRTRNADSSSSVSYYVIGKTAFFTLSLTVIIYKSAGPPSTYISQPCVTLTYWYFFFTFYRGIIVNSDLDPFSSSLSFHDLKTKHSGNYTCVASNSVAQDSQSSNLVVNGKHMECVLDFSTAERIYLSSIIFVSRIFINCELV